MIKTIIGRKLGMTQVFGEEGEAIPVTVLEAGPCFITQVKTVENDGYNALQLGYGIQKPKRVNKPLTGHFAKSGKGPFRILREVRVDSTDGFDLGQEIKVDIFQVGERVDVIGTSKGRGFAGTIKRWGFHRGPVSHGSKNTRPPGSIGCSAWPSRVIKGKKLPGHMGNRRVTVKSLQVVDVRPEQNLLLVKGAVAGAPNSFVIIRKTNKG